MGPDIVSINRWLKATVECIKRHRSGDMYMLQHDGSVAVAPCCDILAEYAEEKGIVSASRRK